MKYILIIFVFIVSSLAEEDKGWNSLPAETVAAFRLNLSEDALSDIQVNTKLGRQVFSKERFSQFIKIIQKHSLTNPKLAAIMAEVRSAGFSLDELLQICHSKIGFGVLPETHGDDTYWTILGWADLKGDLAHKTFAQLKEKSKAKLIKVSGREALLFVEENKTAQTLLVELEGQLLVAINDLDEKSKNRKVRSKSVTDSVASGEFIESRKLTSDKGSKEASLLLCKKHLSSFVDDLKSSKLGTFAKTFKETQIDSNRVSEGKRVMDFHVNVAKILHVVEPGNKQVKMLGLGGLESFSTTLALSGNSLNSSFFIEAAEPREGILGLLNQPRIESRPPAWVPADINSYNHISFDFELLLTQLKKIASKQFGPAAVENRVKKADLSLQAFVGIKLESLLKSFGQSIMVLDYGVNLADKKADFLQSNVAVVIPFDNNKILDRVIEIMTPFAANSGIMRNDKLGFKGLSFDTPDFTGGFFMGHKFIILTSGEGVDDKLLNSIAAPNSAQSLVNSSAYKAFAAKEKVPDGILFSYGDLSKNGVVLYDVVKKMIDQNQALINLNKRDRSFINEMIQNLPSKKELEGIFGISHGYAYPDKSGVTFKGTIELP
jgi:hypothetical protein